MVHYAENNQFTYNLTLQTFNFTNSTGDFSYQELSFIDVDTNLSKKCKTGVSVLVASSVHRILTREKFAELSRKILH